MWMSIHKKQGIRWNEKEFIATITAARNEAEAHGVVREKRTIAHYHSTQNTCSMMSLEETLQRRRSKNRISLQLSLLRKLENITQEVFLMRATLHESRGYEASRPIKASTNWNEARSLINKRNRTQLRELWADIAIIYSYFNQTDSSLMFCPDTCRASDPVTRFIATSVVDYVSRKGPRRRRSKARKSSIKLSLSNVKWTVHFKCSYT